MRKRKGERTGVEGVNVQGEGAGVEGANVEGQV